MTVGEKIKGLRKQLRYTQLEFAALVGVSQTAISQYELDQKTPGFDVLKAIMKFAKSNKVKIKLLED